MNTRSRIGNIGYRYGVAAASFTVAFDLVQAAQLIGWLRFPLDELLIYGTSLCIVVPFIVEMAALHVLVEKDKQLWTQVALIFAGIYAVFASANYVVQLATVIPLKMTGTLPVDYILEQSPHSLFWDFDALGYISMGIAALFGAVAIPGTGRDRWVRLSLLAHAFVTPLICIVYFYPVYSARLLLIGIPWAVTAPLFMLMLAIHLRDRTSHERSAA